MNHRVGCINSLRRIARSVPSEDRARSVRKLGPAVYLCGFAESDVYHQTIQAARGSQLVASSPKRLQDRGRFRIGGEY